jgi:selenide,water dikinase
LGALAPISAPDLVVGLDTGDDALVWRSGDRFLVATTDFFAPIIDDPRRFGRIAATNAVSDIYAMGGRPLFGLNVVGWPAAQPLAVLGEILAGGQQAAVDGGWVVAGGHTIDAAEPFYGQAIIGEVTPGGLLTNAGAHAEEAVVLTKPLGTGTITTAAKAQPDRADVQTALDGAVEEMLRSNATASVVAARAGATACTDVTGFGLVGHLAKLAAASGCSVILDSAAVPSLPGARELIREGFVPGGTGRNRSWLGDRVQVAADEAVDAEEVGQWLALLADPQTSGGLVFTCPQGAAKDAVEELMATGHRAAIIGRTTPRSDWDIRVER